MLIKCKMDTFFTDTSHIRNYSKHEYSVCMFVFMYKCQRTKWACMHVCVPAAEREWHSFWVWSPSSLQVMQWCQLFVRSRMCDAPCMEGLHGGQTPWNAISAPVSADLHEEQKEAHTARWSWEGNTRGSDDKHVWQFGWVALGELDIHRQDVYTHTHTLSHTVSLSHTATHTHLKMHSTLLPTHIPTSTLTHIHTHHNHTFRRIYLCSHTHSHWKGIPTYTQIHALTL